MSNIKSHPLYGKKIISAAADYPPAWPAGTTICKLEKIELKETKIYNDPNGATEEKLWFYFKPIDPRKEGQCVAKVRPKMGLKAGMRNLLDSMSPTGAIPDAHMVDPDTYLEYALLQINNIFYLRHKSSDDGRFNNLVGLMPFTGEMAPALAAEAAAAAVPVGVSIADDHLPDDDAWDFDPKAPV